MSETAQISSEPANGAVEPAVEAKPDNKSKPVRKPSGKSNDPINKFSGDGVVYRAKLFGTADVREPRGDQICATAMNLLKSAVKSTGEHKQKILLKINLNGLVIVDAITQIKLYEHPVNKISFIAKDPTDNRAFGYIIGEKDGAHMYFGIKTEKAAEQVVITLRELFQTVFDMKKKEAELKGKTTAETTTVKTPAAQESSTPSTTQPTPAATSPQPETTPAPAQEPALGDETDAAPKPEVKREDSQSHLLDLLDNLSFVTQPPAQSMNANFGQQGNPPAAWGNSVNPTVAPGWGGSAPAQNDPFATASATGMFSQQQPFNQPTAFPSQTQQPAQPQFQANFNQPNAMSGYNQQPFAQSQPTQQNPFNTQSNSAMFMPPQVPVNGSPFASPAPASQPAAFPSDPFATGFRASPIPQQQPASSNPFAGGNESFGVLQPQQVPQPAQFAAPQPAAPGNLFSDLNPLPGANNNVRKDRLFDNVKNPPKPKLNELQSSQPAQQPTNTTNPFAIPNQPQPVAQLANQLDLEWLENKSSSTTADQPNGQTSSAAAAPAKQGLLPPPPSNIRQRQSNLGHSAVVRPR